jgi:DNA repair exonuclease SbcCD nuclease subunit
MSSFRFVHAADLHIDSPLRGLESDSEAPVEQIRGATRAAFTNLVELALEEQVAFVLIAGDLFDGEWPDWRTGQFFMQQTARLRQANIRVVGIRGNHDAESVISRRLPKDAIRMLRGDRPESVRLPEFDVCIHGQSFATRDVTENLARNYPPPLPGHFNIGLLHTAATGRDGHDNYAPCGIEQLAHHGYDYWALGHVHTREELLRDPCWIVFPGNIQGRDIGEAGPKGASLVTVREGRVATVEPRELDVVRWVRLEIDLDGASDIEDVISRLHRKLGLILPTAGDRLLAIRLVFQGACPAHIALMRDIGATRDIVRTEMMGTAGTGAVWLESVKIRTRPALNLQAMLGRSDATGLLVRSIDAASPEQFSAAMQEYCASLLDRVSGLRRELGDMHPATLAAAGIVAPELIEQAKNLLLARLAEH